MSRGARIADVVVVFGTLLTVSELMRRRSVGFCHLHGKKKSFPKNLA